MDGDDVGGAAEQVRSLEAELARRDAEVADAWGRYHELRGRKVVRGALALARLKPAARSAVERLKRAAPPSAQPVAPAPVEPEPPEPAAADGPPWPVEVPEGVLHCWPLGHYYSPVPDTRVLREEPAHGRIWGPAPRETPGIDWRAGAQAELVRDVFARQAPMPFPAASTGDPAEYHTGNEFFSALDAWALQAMLRHVEPKRMIEVGCGWSSLVTARVNREHLGGALEFTCIEPYPPEFLEGGVDGISELIAAPVQDVPVERFLELGDGDVLFIDSSHVIKTGGDVQYLYHEVLPRLAAGVVVHVHDIFLPWDYPEEWVLVGRGWNEQYLLQSFLTCNDEFEILLGIAWMSHFHPELLAQAIPGYPETTRDGGGSFWMRRRAGASA